MIFFMANIAATLPACGFHNTFDNATEGSSGPDSRKSNLNIGKFIFSPGMHDLFTTHATEFSGESLIAGYHINNFSWIGLGTEISHSKLHDDNGWQLTRLKFRPLFLDMKIDFYRYKRFICYFKSSQGISFNRFDEIKQSTTGNPMPIKENGIYLYTGTGFNYLLSSNLSPDIEAGFKGYHMSFNKLDVNPHGLNLKVGLFYYF